HGVEVQYREDVYYPAVNNDVNLVSRLKEFLPHRALQDIQPMMIAEDFSYYQQRVPGVYMFLGCENESKGFTAPLHSSKFNFDEEALLYGLQAYHDIIKGFGVVR